MGRHAVWRKKGGVGMAPQAGKLEGSWEEKHTKMTKQDWLEQQKRNLRNLEFRMKFPPDNYQTITKSY